MSMPGGCAPCPDLVDTSIHPFQSCRQASVRRPCCFNRRGMRLTLVALNQLFQYSPKPAQRSNVLRSAGEWDLAGMGWPYHSSVDFGRCHLHITYKRDLPCALRLQEDCSPMRLSHSSCGVQGVLQANTARKPCATFVVPSPPALHVTRPLTAAGPERQPCLWHE